jgi:uncharacterized protein (TIGR03086 family)
MAKGESIDELSRALDLTGAIVSGIGADQAGLPTPCPDWNVGELVDHLVHDLQTFTARARGEGPGAGAGTNGGAGEGTNGGAGDGPNGAAAEGAGADADTDADAEANASPDFVAPYRRAANGLLASWRSRGGLDQTVESPFGDIPLSWFVGQNTADVLVHGWDLAKATGQPIRFDASLAEASADWGRENLLPERRGDAFAQEVTVPADAPAADRLAAVFGRDPAWAPTVP